MNRTSWKFQYPADKLLSATITKKAFHEGRLKWWSDKQVEIKEKIKNEGLEIDESLAWEAGGGHMSKLSSNYRAPVAQINNELLRNLEECVNKVAEHRGRYKDYEAWEQVLASQGKAHFELNQDDWLFFFGK